MQPEHILHAGFGDVPRWRAQAKPLAETDYRRYDAVLQIVNKTAAPGDALFAAAADRRRHKEQNIVLSTILPGGVTVTRLQIDKAADTFTRLESIRRALAPLLMLAPAALAIDIHDTAVNAAEVLYAVLVGAAKLPGDDAPSPDRIVLAGATKTPALRTAAITAQANTLARALTQLPPNVLTPPAFATFCQRLAQKHGLTVKRWTAAQLRRLGAGAISAVGRAGPESSSLLLHLAYRPSARRRVALTGKGVCFDTGGVNVKPANYMRGMGKDMAGAATALAVINAVAELRLPIGIDAWLTLAENNIGPLSYRPDEVITALNGKRIEIIHTDAEGRMLLADTLTLASRQKPALLISYATLTGAMHVAVGDRMSGFFAAADSADALKEAALMAAAASGERLCYFPMPQDYREDLKSDIADIKQCPENGEADHIYAALFLREFIAEQTPWLHLDLSAAARKGGLAAAPGKVTGFGAAWTLAFLSAWRE